MDIDIENLRQSWNIFDIITGRLDVIIVDMNPVGQKR